MIADLIFDVGMNTGQDTDFYLKKGFRVVAIEANALQVREARWKFKWFVLRRRLTLLNVAIGHPGRRPFYINETHHEWSSLVEEIGARGGRFRRVEVEVVTLDSVMRRFGTPYYLKIDIEGMDRLAVASLAQTDDRPAFVSVESGPGPQWLDSLHELAYRWFKLVDQSLVPSVRCPRPALEGRFVDYQFKAGSSGPFGEEAPGPWLSLAEARQSLLEILGRRTPGADFWFDIHAKR